MEPDAKSAKATRAARRKQIGQFAIASVALVWALLVILTTGLLVEEFTSANPEDAAGTQPVVAETGPTPGNAVADAVPQPSAEPEPVGPDHETDTASAPRSETTRPVRPVPRRPLTLDAVEPAWKRPPAEAVLTRIGVGSCLHQAHPQPIWSAIIESAPDLFLMLGDNVYGDIRKGDPQQLADAYNRQAAHPEFVRARQAMPFLATWDDHDYGMNDAGAGYEFQPQAASIFRRFWQLPEAKQADGGIYYTKTFGPPGQRVQIIFLDTRTFRSPLTRKSEAFPYWGKYEPSSTEAQTMLGDAQWAWLEQQLAEPAEIRLLASSVQILADGHGWERWGNLPKEKARLEALLTRTDARGVIMLSGDRHSAAIYRTEVARDRAQPQLFELTASSLNRAYGPSWDARVPPLVSDIYHRENSGLIEIDWDARSVELSIRGIDGTEVTRREIAFADLGLDQGTSP